VLARSNIRGWQSWTTEGQLFDLYLIDITGNIMKATIFNQMASDFDTVLERGVVVSISGGRIKHSNATFTSDLYELVIEENSKLQTLPGTSMTEVNPTIVTTTLESLAELQPNEKVNVLAVVHKVAAAKSVKNAKGKQLTKRDILVVDATMTKVICTLWGPHAKSDLECAIGQPLLFKTATISEYNGSRTLNVGIAAELLLDPACPNARTLAIWYSNINTDAGFKSI
jgi:ssDNA-binding replication factor A large subunit